VEGRAAEIFWVYDGSQHRMVHAALFHSVIDALGEIREWQAVQRERNRLEVRLELLPNSKFSADSGEAMLRRMFQEQGLPAQVTVDVRIVPHLAPDAVTNKFRRMLSEVGPPDDIAT
jgi:phenylacetate-coenzyme A ligase PaaK-like adenylate-forming protein